MARYKSFKLATVYLLICGLAFAIGVLSYGLLRERFLIRNEALPALLRPRLLSGGSEQQGDLDLKELTRVLLEACNDRVPYQKAYYKIPKLQRQQLSLEEFERYFSLLARQIGGSGLSLRPLSLSEQAQLMQALQQTSGLEFDAKKGRFFWFESEQSSRLKKRFPVYFELGGDGIWRLSTRWIQASMDLYTFADFYFATLQRQDAEALSALLSSTGKNAQERKAQLLLDYYQQQIFPLGEKAELSEWSMGRLVFRQNAMDERENSSVRRTRQLSFLRKATGEIEVIDIVPQAVEEQVFELQKQNFVLHLGDLVESEQLKAVLGAPLFVKVEEGSGHHRRLMAVYNPLHLLLGEPQSYDEKAQRYVARVESLILRSPDLQLGTGLKIGMSERELLERYPFLDLMNYTLANEETGQVIQFKLQDHRIEEIRVSLNERGLTPGQ